MDTLHVILRHVVLRAWENLAGQQAFKGVVIDREMMSWGVAEFSLENQIRNKMACGTSATRLCEILAGTPMSDIMTNPKAVPLIDGKAPLQALEEMRAVEGHLIVRINVIGGGAGHSYVFLSKQRSGGDDLQGYIYQTNVGCHVSNAFGLNDWVADAKSLQEVDLAWHLCALATRLCGIGNPKDMTPDGFYQDAYMLSSKSMHEGDTSEILKMAAQEGTRAKVRFMWAPVDVDAAMRRLSAILVAKVTDEIRM
ncbi:hypothetical protein JR064_09345 [Xanthomonas sp. CFBP 8703]|uniref:Uncharacterized protein n=1 Tax=Xanthomonas bonasiae TaxID=2810351 RepID=A0ABS3B658_9XANT|nr:hypothetical protein [Xanthomonas bonasiae]MBN6102369.1 hypothetical protein [Xanthomonas bonasiae]MBN6112744.1 hypothetical protein [Xanthomonas bonasiae]